MYLVKVEMKSKMGDRPTSRTLEIRDATDRLDASRKGMLEARQEYGADYYGLKVTSVQRDK